MSYEFYKVLHYLGLIGLFTSIGAIALLDQSRRKAFVVLHGISLVLLLVAGFGLAARLGMIRGLPLWIYLKLGVWFLLAGWPVIVRRKPQYAMISLYAAMLLGATAAWLAVNKPI